jgi:hypothetical protein
MKPNMGTLDRSLRILFSFIIIGLYFTNQISGTAAIILLVVAGIFIVTSFLSFCPLYLPFGFSTKQKS